MNKRAKETLKLSGYITSSLIVLAIIICEGIYLQWKYPIYINKAEESFMLKKYVTKYKDVEQDQFIGMLMLKELSSSWTSDYFIDSYKVIKVEEDETNSFVNLTNSILISNGTVDISGIINNSIVIGTVSIVSDTYITNSLLTDIANITGSLTLSNSFIYLDNVKDFYNINNSLNSLIGIQNYHDILLRGEEIAISSYLDIKK